MTRWELDVTDDWESAKTMARLGWEPIGASSFQRKTFYDGDPAYEICTHWFFRRPIPEPKPETAEPPKGEVIPFNPRSAL